MANLFKKQGKKYSDNRPGYPDELFRFISSKTPKPRLGRRHRQRPSRRFCEPRPAPARRCLRRVVLHPPAHGVDSVFNRYYATSGPYWDAAGRLVEEEYRTVAFPFGPSMVEMGLDGFLDYLRSSSRYQTAKDQGVELLGEEVVAEFKAAWGGEGTKVVRFPVFLRIGRVVE
ncbi:hypothetical protein QJS04_geneDACA016618 [Acorus gramineus]|uniref:Uncharacterized protein n=1 Tax=Acorus gramineus TaxID=55184 RepID=A0AAV9BPE2_ACOGR|nr:hypothetical protein QJS04_geneDACA016618 [Acorus gramineus]